MRRGVLSGRLFQACRGVLLRRAALKVSSATPDLSSFADAERDHAGRTGPWRSLGERQVRDPLARELESRCRESFAACAAEKYTSCSRFCMSRAVGLEHARVGAGLREHLAQHRQVEPERVAQAQPFGQAGGVDVHDHVDERFDLGRLAAPADVAQRGAHPSSIGRSSLEDLAPAADHEVQRAVAGLRDRARHARFDAVRAVRLGARARLRRAPAA